MSKSRVAPIKKLFVVRLELSAAVLAVRIRCFIVTNCRIDIQGFIHIVDSEVVRSMIQRESYGFNTFVGTRLGEIHTYSKPKEWFWLKGSKSIADIITRGQICSELYYNSTWQNDPEFMSKPVELWPIKDNIVGIELPERNNIILSMESKVESKIIDNERYSKYVFLLNVTAIMLKLKDKFLRSLLNR